MRRCPNGEISPCHEKAECIVERDGSLSCAVRPKPPCRGVCSLGFHCSVLGLALPSPGEPSRHSPALHQLPSCFRELLQGSLGRTALAPHLHCWLGGFCA